MQTNLEASSKKIRSSDEGIGQPNGLHVEDRGPKADAPFMELLREGNGASEGGKLKRSVSLSPEHAQTRPTSMPNKEMADSPQLHMTSALLQSRPLDHELLSPKHPSHQLKIHLLNLPLSIEEPTMEAANESDGAPASSPSGQRWTLGSPKTMDFLGRLADDSAKQRAGTPPGEPLSSADFLRQLTEASWLTAQVRRASSSQQDRPTLEEGPAMGLGLPGLTLGLDWKGKGGANGSSAEWLQASMSSSHPATTPSPHSFQQVFVPPHHKSTSSSPPAGSTDPGLLTLGSAAQSWNLGAQSLEGLQQSLENQSLESLKRTLEVARTSETSESGRHRRVGSEPPFKKANSERKESRLSEGRGASPPYRSISDGSLEGGGLERSRSGDSKSQASQYDPVSRNAQAEASTSGQGTLAPALQAFLERAADSSIMRGVARIPGREPEPAPPAPSTSKGRGSRSRDSESGLLENPGGHHSFQGKGPKSGIAHILFEKVLTASDTSQLGRIILPKVTDTDSCQAGGQLASVGKVTAGKSSSPLSQPSSVRSVQGPSEKYLPVLAEEKEGLSLVVEDSEGGRWLLRYKFWPNGKSRMYILENTGDFIRAHGLAPGDTVTFCRSEPGHLLLSLRKGQPGAPGAPQGSRASSTPSESTGSKRPSHRKHPDSTPTRSSEDPPISLGLAKPLPDTRHTDPGAGLGPGTGNLGPSTGNLGPSLGGLHLGGLGLAGGAVPGTWGELLAGQNWPPGDSERFVPWVGAAAAISQLLSGAQGRSEEAPSDLDRSTLSREVLDAVAEPAARFRTPGFTTFGTGFVGRRSSVGQEAFDSYSRALAGLGRGTPSSLNGLMSGLPMFDFSRGIGTPGSAAVLGRVAEMQIRPKQEEAARDSHHQTLQREHERGRD